MIIPTVSFNFLQQAQITGPWHFSVHPHSSSSFFFFFFFSSSEEHAIHVVVLVASVVMLVEGPLTAWRELRGSPQVSAYAALHSRHLARPFPNNKFIGAMRRHLPFTMNALYTASALLWCDTKHLHEFFCCLVMLLSLLCSLRGSRLCIL